MSKQLKLSLGFVLLIIVLIFFIFSRDVHAQDSSEPALNEKIQVEILYDFSGSMYPGYPDTPRHESGVDFFHQYPGFRQWLTKLVEAQERFNPEHVSISTFRSMNQFDENDIEQILEPVRLNEAVPRIEPLFSGLVRSPGVDYTHLRESLDYFTRGDFKGLVWIITDNRVEGTEAGQTTRQFFKSLKEQDKYRSVHIYKYRFDDREKGQWAELAIYAVMVSPDEIGHEALSALDAKLNAMKEIFPGGHHLKLKDLRVDPVSLQLESSIGINTGKGAKTVKTEGELKRLPFGVTLKSKLTQHTITGGKLTVQLEGDLIPKDKKLAEQYGIKNIPASMFEPAKLTLMQDIPPGTSKNLGRFYLFARGSFSIPVTGLMNKLKAGFKPFNVEFTGHGRLSSGQLNVELKSEGIESIRGIYSSGDIESIFLPEDRRTTIDTLPVRFSVSFTLKTSASRGLLLLFIFTALAVPLFILFLILRRKGYYRIRIKDKESRIALRRMGKYDVTHKGNSLGVIKRGMSPLLTFEKNNHTKDLSIKPTGNQGEFLVHMPVDDKNEEERFFLFIESLRPHQPIKKTEEHSTGPGPNKPVNTGPHGASGPRIKIKQPKR